MEEQDVQTNVTGILRAAIRSTIGIRAYTPGESICADRRNTFNQAKYKRKNVLTYAVFTGTFSESDVHDIVMQVPCVFLG
jgi:hypothetical protein